MLDYAKYDAQSVYSVIRGCHERSSHAMAFPFDIQFNLIYIGYCIPFFLYFCIKIVE